MEVLQLPSTRKKRLKRKRERKIQLLTNQTISLSWPLSEMILQVNFSFYYYYYFPLKSKGNEQQERLGYLRLEEFLLLIVT